MKPLSKRQVELYELLVHTDLPAKQIARRMGIKPESLRSMATLLYAKLVVRDRIELMHREIERLQIPMENNQ